MSEQPGPPGGRALVPLGQSLGPRDGGLLFDVRVHDRVLQLDPVQWAVWALAHGLPGGQGPWTVDDVVLQGTAAGLPDTAQVLADLVADGLVTDAPRDAESAGEVRVVVALLSLGNTAEAPDTWALGLPGQPLVHLDHAVHQVIALGHRDGDLWTTVQSVAGSLERLQAPDPVAGDPHLLLARVLDALATLLPTGAVYLDRAAGAAA